MSVSFINIPAIEFRDYGKKINERDYQSFSFVRLIIRLYLIRSVGRQRPSEQSTC